MSLVDLRGKKSEKHETINRQKTSEDQTNKSRICKLAGKHQPVKLSNPNRNGGLPFEIRLLRLKAEKSLKLVWKKLQHAE